MIILPNPHSYAKQASDFTHLHALELAVLIRTIVLVSALSIFILELNFVSLPPALGASPFLVNALEVRDSDGKGAVSKHTISSLSQARRVHLQLTFLFPSPSSRYSSTEPRRLIGFSCIRKRWPTRHLSFDGNSWLARVAPARASYLHRHRLLCALHVQRIGLAPHLFVGGVR